MFSDDLTVPEGWSALISGGVLTLTDKNGKTYSGEGDPIKLHYVYSGSDQLTGDYTIPASALAFGSAEGTAEAAPEASAEPIPQ